MSEQIKECWNCYYYKAYYTKGFCYFDKQKVGYCTNHDKMVESNHQTCELWRRNITFRALRKAVAMKKLNENLDILLELKQILFEENEDNNIDPFITK